VHFALCGEYAGEPCPPCPRGPHPTPSPVAAVAGRWKGCRAKQQVLAMRQVATSGPPG